MALSTAKSSLHGPKATRSDRLATDNATARGRACHCHGYLTGAVGKWHRVAPRLIYPYDPSPDYQDHPFLEKQNNLTREHCREFGFGV